MSIVGTFPGLGAMSHQVIRAPVNPLDKSTIVSIYPKPISDRKPTLQPGVFTLAPGSLKNPSILVVGPSSWWSTPNPEQPTLEIPTSSVVIANSVVNDYCGSLLECSLPDIMPGLFYVPGEHTVEEIKSKYSNELNLANSRQNTWYGRLVRMADSLWARSNGNPLTIDDNMRMAARELGIQDTKDWMKDFKMVEMVRCKACGAIKNPHFPVCATCHFPDPDHPMTKEFLAAKNVVPQTDKKG